MMKVWVLYTWHATHWSSGGESGKCWPFLVIQISLAILVAATRSVQKSDSHILEYLLLIRPIESVYQVPIFWHYVITRALIRLSNQLYKRQRELTYAYDASVGCDQCDKFLGLWKGHNFRPHAYGIVMSGWGEHGDSAFVCSSGYNHFFANDGCSMTLSQTWKWCHIGPLPFRTGSCALDHLNSGSWPLAACIPTSCKQTPIRKPRHGKSCSANLQVGQLAPSEAPKTKKRRVGLVMRLISVSSLSESSVATHWSPFTCIPHELSCSCL